MTIWAHTLVKNEERYIWYAIMSIINHVDKILVYDTGSTDMTVSIVRSIIKDYPKKVILKEVGEVTINTFTDVRQEMLSRTKSDWFLVLDGDEVWWDTSIENLVRVINENRNLESVVNRHYSMTGDIYHYQSESTGKYRIDNSSGHINIRAVSMSIPGLHFEKPHGQLGLYDGSGVLIQNRSSERRVHMDEISYLHFTNMRRSGSGDSLVPKRGFKYKYVLGKEFPPDFFYPEVFFIDRPDIVPSPWERRSLSFEVRAQVESPLRKIKLKLPFLKKTGY